MSKKTPPVNNKVKTKSSTWNPVQKTDPSKIRALEEQLAQREAELAIINSIQAMPASKMDSQGIIDAVGDKLSEIFEDGNVGFAFLDKAREIIAFPYIIENGKRIEYFELTLTESGLMQHILKRRRPVVINSKFGERFEGIGTFNYPGRDLRDLKSWVTVPIFNGDEIIGGASLRSWDRENAFSDSDVRLLQTIVNSMSIALENVRLFDETQRLLKEAEQRATELQIINNIGQTLTEVGDLTSMIERVGARIQEALNVKDIVISVFDEKTSHVLSPYMVRNGKQVEITEENIDLRRFKLGIRASARTGGRSWVVNKVAEKTWRKWWTSMLDNEVPKSFVTLPLLAGKEVIGGITIADYERENAFSDLSVNLLETIASNMGTAVQNVRLFDETQRLLKETEQRATELQIINNIGQTLTESGDLENIIQRVGERMQEALNINNIAISIFDEETEHVIAPYMVRNGEQIKLTEENFDLRRYKILIHAWARAGGKGASWVINKDVDKIWRKSWRGPIADDVPKSMVVLPLLAGGEIIGGISLADYENDNAFTELSVNLLETIASNMGTAVQNVRLFDETKRLFTEAEEARAAAERANKAKSTFLANMSHELRTPLNAIMGFTSIVKGKAEGVLPEKQISNLEKVLASSQHLLGLINTVLDLAKIEAGRMDVIPAKFHLNALIDLCSNLSTPLLKPDITLEKQVDETIGIIYSDQDKIKQILLNLLSNAAKFTHAGSILLSVEKSDPETLNISVTDSGIGINEKAIERVFEEFQQADSTTTRQYGGTGLGLPISRNLARLLGGDLTATSELGKGSTFTLTIPTQYGRKPAASPDPKPDTIQPTESQTQAGADASQL